MNGLSKHLSSRYARHISSVAVTLQHGACLLLGSSLDPAYIVAVHALPELVQTATNKRNAALLQRHLQDALDVVPARGIVRFVGVPEECLARGGRTVAGELTGEKDKQHGIERDEEGKGEVQRRRTVRVRLYPPIISLGVVCSGVLTRQIGRLVQAQTRIGKCSATGCRRFYTGYFTRKRTAYIT